MPSSNSTSGTAIVTCDRIIIEAMFRSGSLIGGHAGVGQELAHAGQQVVGLDVARLEHLGVVGMQADPGAGRLADAAGQPVVVGVDVGDQHGPDVADATRRRRPGRRSAPPRRRRCSIRRRRWPRRRRARGRRRARSAAGCPGSAPGSTTVRVGPAPPGACTLLSHAAFCRTPVTTTMPGTVGGEPQGSTSRSPVAVGPGRSDRGA